MTKDKSTALLAAVADLLDSGYAYDDNDVCVGKEEFFALRAIIKDITGVEYGTTVEEDYNDDDDEDDFLDVDDDDVDNEDSYEFQTPREPHHTMGFQTPSETGFFPPKTNKLKYTPIPKEDIDTMHAPSKCPVCHKECDWAQAMGDTAEFNCEEHGMFWEKRGK